MENIAIMKYHFHVTPKGLTWCHPSYKRLPMKDKANNDQFTKKHKGHLLIPQTTLNLIHANQLYAPIPEDLGLSGLHCIIHIPELNFVFFTY